MGGQMQQQESAMDQLSAHRPSPAALPESDSMMSDHTNNTGVDEPPSQPSSTAKTPMQHRNNNPGNTWGGNAAAGGTAASGGPNNGGGGMGPLRESRLQNMPQKRLMMQPHMHHPHHGHFQHGHSQMPGYHGGGPHPGHHHSMHPHAGHSHHHPHPHLSSENAVRMPMLHHYHPDSAGFFKADNNMGGGGGPQGPHFYRHPSSDMKASASPSQNQQDGSQETMTGMQSQEQQDGGKDSPTKGNPKKKGAENNGTMDAASILLQLGKSASPTTVSSATQGDMEKPLAEPKNLARMEDEDDVPALASSSSSLSPTMNSVSKPGARSTESMQQDHQARPQLPSQVKPKKFEPQHYEVPENYPTRLALPNDEAKLNSLHCFLRSELLEIFVVERSANKSPTHSPGSSVGRVGLRCVFCAMSRKRSLAAAEGTEGAEAISTTSSTHRCDEAPMAVFYPKSIAEIYRLVTSWQRCHLRKCRNLPPDIRSKWTLLRENDKSRGKTHYWITSAKEIGLIDCQSRAGGIRFCTGTGSALKATKSSPAANVNAGSFTSSDTSPSASSDAALKSPEMVSAGQRSVKSETTAFVSEKSAGGGSDSVDKKSDQHRIYEEATAKTPVRNNDMPSGAPKHENHSPKESRGSDNQAGESNQNSEEVSTQNSHAAAVVGV